MGKSQDAMQAVIISFDSLATNSLGCYGNEWVETPRWDRLAATGAVFDRHFADTLGSLSGMAWSNGRHALSTPSLNQHTGLGTFLRSNKVSSRLVVSGELKDWQRQFLFDDVRAVGGQDGVGAKPDETPFAEVVKAAIDIWNDPLFREQPRVLWLHAPGPGIPPEGFDELYFEDFEERGQEISELTDDDRSRHPAVYAGAVSLLDHWLGEFLAGIRANELEEPTLVIVTAARGHLWQQIKPSRSNETSIRTQGLCDQLARTPLVVKVHGDPRFKELVCLRSDRLVQTCDLVPTLIDWFALQADDAQLSAPVARSWLRELTEEIPRRASLVYNDGDLNDAVRTDEWLCIRSKKVPYESDAGAQGLKSDTTLFVKPEDIWDINDVASQQPEIVTQLLAQIPVRHSNESECMTGPALSVIRE